MKVKKFDKKNRVLEVELLPPAAKDVKSTAHDGMPSRGVLGGAAKSLSSRWGEDDGAGVRVTLPNGKRIVL